jgi:hypothetical protein
MAFSRGGRVETQVVLLVPFDCKNKSLLLATTQRALPVLMVLDGRYVSRGMPVFISLLNGLFVNNIFRDERQFELETLR